MNFIKTIFTIYYYIRAKSFFQKDNEVRSYEYLKKINTDIIEKYYSVEYYLFLGYTSLYLRKFNESEIYFRKAIFFINKDKNITLNKDEKNYLKCYALILLKALYKHLNKNTYLFQTEIDSLKGQFNKENIKRTLLGYFPIK